MSAFPNTLDTTIDSESGPATYTGPVDALQTWDKGQEAEPGVLAAIFDPQGKPALWRPGKTWFLGDVIEPPDQPHLKPLNLYTF